jgi:hypothetical protein
VTPDELEELAQSYAVTVAPALAVAVHERDAGRVNALLAPLDRQQLLTLSVVLASQVGHPRTRPDDGVIDEVAVRRAVNGEQTAPLTRAERTEAVRILHEQGMGAAVIARHLRMSDARVKKIINREGVA